MVELNKYPIPSEPATASYNWTEIASGEGYVFFYVFRAVVAGLVYSYHLVNNSALGVANTIVTTGGIDIDTTAFNTPRTIKGRAYIQATSSSGNNILVKIYHVDASATETQLGSSFNMDDVTATGGYVDIPETLVKKGEKIRLNLTASSSDHTLSNVILALPFDIDL